MTYACAKSPGAPKRLRQLGEEAEVEIDLVIRRTVEGPGRRLREAAARIHRVAKQRDDRPLVAAAQQLLHVSCASSATASTKSTIRSSAGERLDLAGCRRSPTARRPGAEERQSPFRSPSSATPRPRTPDAQRHGGRAARPPRAVLDVAAISRRPFHGSPRGLRRAGNRHFRRGGLDGEPIDDQPDALGAVGNLRLQFLA